jgi:hypothetical protein
MVRRSTRPALPTSKYLLVPLTLAGDRATTIRQLLSIYKHLPADRAGDYVSWIAEATGAGRCPVDVASEMWMTWDMVRDLRDAGMAVGGHTVNHPVLAGMTRAAQEREIADCAARLYAELGEPMRWFAYPVGAADAFNQDTRHALAAAGVELAFTYYGGHRRYDDWDPYDVRRISVETHITGEHFRALASWPALLGPPDGQRLTGRLRESWRGWTGG